MAKTTASFAERFLFSKPVFYKLKCFLIQTVIWKWILSGLFRMNPRVLSDTDGLFVGQRVLVAACGPGDVTTGPSVDAAAEISAFDISTEVVQACQRNRPTWKVRQADVLHLPYADGEFDVTVIYSALHHIPANAADVLAELARVSSKRVVFMEGVVPPKGLFRRLLLLWYRIVDGGVHYYTREELLEIASKVGLKVERATQHGPIAHMMFAVLGTEPSKNASRSSSNASAR